MIEENHWSKGCGVDMASSIIQVPKDKDLSYNIEYLGTPPTKAINIFRSVFENSVASNKRRFPNEIQTILDTFEFRQNRGEDTNILLGQLKELIQAIDEGNEVGVIKRLFDQYLYTL